MDSNNGWPDHVLADISREAYFARMTGLEYLLETKGKFQNSEVSKALISSDRRTKKEVAAWLRWELRKLRSVQSEGGHPIRRHKTLSILEIADAALTDLEPA